MVLAEILIEKENLKRKIEELELVLIRASRSDVEAADEANTKLLDLMDKYRSHLILINKINNSIEVNIGGSVISLANAILITKTIERKVELLDSLIRDESSILDVFSLMEQRDKLLDEYVSMSNTLKAIEWSTNVD
jgi:hypothetical protein